MLLFNVIEPPQIQSRKAWLKPLAGLCVLFIALLWTSWPHATFAKPLGVEEREMVIATFQRLAQESPKLEEWADDYADAVATGSVRLFQTNQQRGVLLNIENDTLFFDEAFFAADSVTQKNAIIDTILPTELRAPTAPEIAVKIK